MAITSSVVFPGPSSAACFVGSKFHSDSHCSPPSRVSFRQLRVSVNCSTTPDRTVRPPYSSPIRSHYEVLGIGNGATFPEIKAAYRKLARVLHPDVAIDNGQKETKAKEFIEVHEAYETLSDPEKRADYDRSFFWRARKMSSSFVTFAMSSSAGFSGRRWETDQCW